MTKRILVALLALVLFFQSFALIISAATTLPFTYKEEGVYSASGKYYTRAVITSDYKELKTGDVFFLDSNGKVVLDSWLITQLYTVSVVGKDVAASAAVSAKSQRELAEIYREIFANIQAMDKMGEIIGSGSGLVLTVFTAQDPVNIGKAALSFAGDVVDIKTAITSSLLLIWSHNAVAYANRVEDLKYKSITDYNALVDLIYYYEQCYASWHLVEELVGDDIQEMGASTVLKQLVKYIKNVFTSFATSIIPGDPAKFINEVTGDTVTFGEIAMDLELALKYTQYEQAAKKIYRKLLFNSAPEYERTAALISQYMDVSEDTGSSGGTTDTSAGKYNKTEAQFASAIEALREEYPHKLYWNNYNGKVASGALKGTSKVGTKKCKCTRACPATCSCSCGTLKINGRDVAWQCHGYALLLAYKIFGTNINSGSSWSKITSLKKYQFCAGDVVRTNEGHTIFIYKVEGSKIYYTDCNYTGPCQINWEGETTVTKLKAKTVYVRHLKGNTLKGTAYEEPSNTLTIHYDSNGGTIDAGTSVGEKYKVTVSAGLNVRAKASASSTKLGAIAKGTVVVVTELKKQSDYTWGKIAYKGKTGWVALYSGWVQKVGTEWSKPYYTVDTAIYKRSTSKLHAQVCTQGTLVPDGLYNDKTFGLYREGYTFLGWSLSATGGELIDQTASFLPEELVPAVADGNQTVTVYAVWKKDSPAQPISGIWLATLPTKGFYTVGEKFDSAGLSLWIAYADGSVEKITNGFTCTPTALSDAGMQEIAVTYEGHTVSFPITINTSKPRANNATALRDSVGYLLPSTSAATLKNQGVYKNDTLQVLCREGDFYLCLIPWGATTTNSTNNVLLYIKAEDINLKSTVPTADEYFDMNPDNAANAIVTSAASVYYRPDGGATPVKYASKEIAPQTVAKGDRVSVLFEMNGYYCVRTATATGFIKKAAVAPLALAYELVHDATGMTVSVGDALTPSDFTASVSLTDGTLLPVDVTVTLPSTHTAGTVYAVLCYGNLTTLVPITVTEPPVQELLVDAMPQKLYYAVGDAFDPAGMKITLVYENGSTRDVTHAVTISYDFSETGSLFVELKYGELTLHIPVTVYAKPEIEISGAEGYVGEYVSIPITLFNDDEHITPTSFDMSVGYNSAKLQFVGIDNAYDAMLFQVTEPISGSLRITYLGDSSTPIDKSTLIVLTFLVKESAALTFNLSEESGDIIIDSAVLTDSLGNSIHSLAGEAFVNNLGQVSVTFIDTADDTTYSIATANYGDYLHIPDEHPVREGYLFRGWSTEENATVATYQPGDPLLCTVQTSLYAVWSAHRPVQSFQHSMQAYLNLEAEVTISVGYKLEDMDAIDTVEACERLGLLVWNASEMQDEALATYDNCTYIVAGAVYNDALQRFETQSLGIAAKNMGDLLSFRAYYRNDDGSYSYSRLITNYSPKTYCYNRIKNNSDNAATVALMAAILNYGAAAQIYFDYETETLMNSALSEQLKTSVWDGSLVRNDYAVPADKDADLARDSEILSRGAYLNLDGAIDYNFYAKLNFTPARATIYYWTEADVATLDVLMPENAIHFEKMTYNAALGRYEGKFEEQAAKEMFDTVYACMVFEDEEGELIYSGVIGYSPERYAYINQNDGNANAELAKSLVSYGDAARTYFQN